MESEFIRWLRNALPSDDRLLVGLGDDAAVLREQPGLSQVVTTDMLMDGVDFELSEVDPRRVGHKALAVNLSDLAAMGSKPQVAFVSVALPRRGDMELAQALYLGMLPLAKTLDVIIAGGDTNSWDAPLAISITAIGTIDAQGPLCRGGAKPGDKIFVTGAFGGSILGRHLDVEPRVREIEELRASYSIHAATDVSDGLACDLNHICVESNLGAWIDPKRIPIHPDAYELETQEDKGVSALQHALTDGEDFELILAVSPEIAFSICKSQPLAALPLTEIGEFVSEKGLWLKHADGSRTVLEPQGYQHGI